MTSHARALPCTQRLILTLTALALGGALLVGCGGSGDEETASAENGIVGGQPDAVSGGVRRIVVPGGTVEVEVSEPMDEVPADLTSNRQTHAAPDDKAFVGVDWQYLPGEGLPSAVRTLTDDPEQRITLALRSGDGKAIALGDARPVAGTPDDRMSAGDIFVPVAEADQDLTVEVGFAGITQSLDVGTGEVAKSAAAGLYDLAEAKPRHCKDLTASRRARTGTKCSTTIWSLPYLDGRGWSEEGWTVVQVDTFTESLKIARSNYRPGDVTDESELSGAEILDRRPVLQEPGVLSLRLFAEGPVDGVDVRRTIAATKSDGPGPQRVKVELSARG